jgi:hypothetical protein
VVAALELTVRDLRTDLRLLHPVLMVAARSLSRELATSQMYGHTPLIGVAWSPPLGLVSDADTDAFESAGA